MSTYPVAALLVLLFSLASWQPILAEDKTKHDLDDAKHALEKLAGEAKKAIGKATDEKPNALWPHSKEALALPKADYTKRAESGLKTMAAEIQALGEAESAVNSRAYFKTRIESLKQQLEYCRQDLDKLTGADTEEAFRVKQKKFDRTLGFLGDNITIAKQEAGL